MNNIRILVSRNKREGWYAGHNEGYKTKPKHWRTGNNLRYSSLKQLAKQWQECRDAIESYYNSVRKA